MSLKLRKATGSDILFLKQLQSKLVDYERAIEPSLKQTGKVEYYDIEKILHSKKSNMLIAEVDGKPVGSAFGEIRTNETWDNEPHHGYIGLMFVEEGYRGHNIGGSIVKELIAWFGTKGVRDIRLKVYAANPAAIRAYEKYGFKRYILEMKYSPDS